MPSSIVKRHLDAALEEAAGRGIPPETIARSLFSFVLQIYKETRSPQDIAEELRAAAENLDDDEEYPFMRP